ncbi:MAG: HAD family phosphatase [Clostridia bacterium]|nr:HAD family phosphatase [Clostridia bacterium]
MPSYKILSCDLDGTLFDHGKHVSEENDRAMRALTARGCLFVINTGRTYSEIPKELREHPAVQYIICSDGAAIYDKKNNTRLSLCMENEVSNQVLDILDDYDTSLTLRKDGSCYVDAATHNDADYIAHHANSAWRYFFYTYGVPKENFKGFCREATQTEMICPFFANADERAEAAERLAALESVQLASTADANLEIFSKKAGKGNALLHLAAQLGIDRAQTIAVGDSTNDSDMILKAGLGLAMENACPELKSIADAVICKNTDHAVPYILRHYLSQKHLFY